MSTELQHEMKRILARLNKRAIPIRSTSALVHDPESSIGIALIRLAGEEHLQAIAYGYLDQPPNIVSFWNPLDRSVPRMEEFAFFLIGYLEHCIQVRQLPRVWVPHRSALQAIEILGERFGFDGTARDPLPRMGKLCSVLAQEACFAGQQVVAVASSLLQEHVVTGQIPSEELHLGALVAWVDPKPGSDPVLEAQKRSLSPANGLLERVVDDEIENLRTSIWKNRTSKGAYSRIEHLLEAGARCEWNLLQEGHRAFWGLGLNPSSQLGVLAKESLERMSWSVMNSPNPPNHPHSLARQLENFELALDMSEDAAVRGDALVRERARQAGRAFGAVIRRFYRDGQENILVLHTEQSVLRIRQGTGISTIDKSTWGKVKTIQPCRGGGSEIVLVVNSPRHMQEGSLLEWTDSSYLDLRSIKDQVYTAMKTAEAPLAYGKKLPPARPRSLLDQDLLSIAMGLRRK